jgi:hypothetical protein
MPRLIEPDVLANVFGYNDLFSQCPGAHKEAQNYEGLARPDLFKKRSRISIFDVCRVIANSAFTFFSAVRIWRYAPCR